MPTSSQNKKGSGRGGAVAAGLAGAAVGAAVGAAAAVVLTDKEKREQIKKSVHTLREKGMELQEKVSKRMDEATRTAEKKVEDVRKQLPKKLDEQKTTRGSNKPAATK